MKALRTGLGSIAAAAVATLALPSTAPAESLVPPGNSGATQYTESYPTAGGPRQTGKGGEGESRSPTKALGARNVRKLDAQGPQGRAAAAAAAATAPSAAVAGATEKTPGAPRAGRSEHAVGVGDAHSSPGLPGGSSGLGEAIGQATGASSGELGPLLPLLIAATVLWSLAFLWRRTRRTAQ
jgi:hypothetical protein